MDRALHNATFSREKALIEIKSLQERIAALRVEADIADRFIADWHKFAAEADSEPTTTAESSLNVDGSSLTATIVDGMQRRRTVGNPKKEDVARAASDIIRKIGAPVGLSDLFKALAERGVVIRGAVPEKTLSTMLWRTAGVLVRLKHGGYWLANEPNEEAGYDPVRDGPDAEKHEQARQSAEDAAYDRENRLAERDAYGSAFD